MFNYDCYLPDLFVCGSALRGLLDWATHSQRLLCNVQKVYWSYSMYITHAVPWCVHGPIGVNVAHVYLYKLVQHVCIDI